jgi:hypothetical protein
VGGSRLFQLKPLIEGLNFEVQIFTGYPGPITLQIFTGYPGPITLHPLLLHLPPSAVPGMVSS